MARQPKPVPHSPKITGEVATRRLQKLVDEIPQLRSATGRVVPAISTWESNVKVVLSDFYGEDSRPYKEFGRIWFEPGVYYDGQPDSEFVEARHRGLDLAAGLLEARISELQEAIHSAPASVGESARSLAASSRKIFVVHGHDHGAKETVARFLAKLDLEPVILHERPDQGRTIIEKFESHASDVACAVVILSADDLASPKSNPEAKEFRARQNVILELGFFVGKLGRARAFALVESGVALPSDLHGLIYIPLNESDWRIRLVRELKAAGLDVDANRAFE